tara:strand:- start:136017 stop:138212 length:2196 start_codon:yes stop_codon:yes gene_type:complete
MFQQIVFLSVLCIVWSGCQSGPFASRSQSSGTLAQKDSETDNESAIQKNLREAMAEERAKVRSGTKRRNGQVDSPASLAERSVKDQRQNRLPVAAESKALPLSSTQQAARQPDDSTVQQELNLAYDADRTGNIEKAQGYYQRVLALDPANYEALHRLAIIEDKKQNFPAAEAYYLRALKIDSSNADLLSDIGYSYMLQGRDDYGEKYLHEALKLQPRHARSLDHLGWFYGRAGQYDQALALFRMTSGEAQAQLKFAQLFPDAELNNNLAQGNMITQHQVQMVAPQNTAPGIQPVGQFQADLSQQVQTAASERQVEQTNPMLTPVGMNPTQQIAEMMKREREKAMQARNMPQQLPAIMPNQAMTNQMTGDPAHSGAVQDTRQFMVNSSGMTPTPAGGTPQIQAWPPVGDPGIAQAVEASNYWAMKEQQQKQNQQAQQLQLQQQQYQNYMSQRGQPMQQEQYQNQDVPYNNSQMNGQQMPQQGMPGNFPQAGQPMYGNQYQVPGQFPDYRMNSTQSPVQPGEPNSESMQQRNDQQLIREAARTGMNMGPGQMFPVAVNGQENTNNSRLMSAQFPANNLLPASAQVADQNIYQAGGQNIRQSQVGQPLYQQQQSMGIRQAGYELSSQQSPHSNGLTSFEQNWNAGGFQQVSSALPPSAMYSHNQEVAPANMRSSNSNMNQGVSGNMYQNGMNPPLNRSQNSFNQNANQQAPSSFQWGTQQPASQSQYPVQQSQY